MAWFDECLDLGAKNMLDSANASKRSDKQVCSSGRA